MTAETPPPVYDDRSEASGLDNSPVGVPGSFIGSSGECVPCEYPVHLCRQPAAYNCMDLMW